MKNCNICPRKCLVDRYNGEIGFCGLKPGIYLSSAVVHYGEEPCFSGNSGVGNLFFTSCNLGCVYCQNYQISQLRKGVPVSEDYLIDQMFKFQDQNVSFLGLVSPSHQAPWIRKALIKAKKMGLIIPVLYNSSSYDLVSELKKWEGIIDIYLADFKYSSENIAKRLSNVTNYVKVAKKAIYEMYKQSGPIVVKNGIAKKGLWIRHLVLPNRMAGTWECLCYLALEVSTNIGISIMAQYEPVYNAFKYKEISRNINEIEYNEAVAMANDLGFEYIITQDIETSPKNAIPDFNLEDPFKNYE